jgi:hypothetical protein
VVRRAVVARKGLASLDAALDVLDARLSSEFREYAELANPKPLTIAAAQAFLDDSEALVLILDVPQFGNLLGETLIWVVTKAEARWARIDLASHALAERAAALRCGLDRAAWEGEGKQRCVNLLAITVETVPDGGKPLPFDLTRAHQLYQALFGQVEDLIKGKHLLIVPSGPLTQIPFHALLTKQSDPVATGNEALRSAAWLAKSNAITVLPSVSSLKALREHAKTSQAKKPFAGFGNPLLDGPDFRSGLGAEMARARQQCSKAPWRHVPGQVAVGMRLLEQRGGLADVASVRAQVPLPETAEELSAVARDQWIRHRVWPRVSGKMEYAWVGRLLARWARQNSIRHLMWLHVEKLQGLSRCQGQGFARRYGKVVDLWGQHDRCFGMRAKSSAEDWPEPWTVAVLPEALPETEAVDWAL